MSDPRAKKSGLGRGLSALLGETGLGDGPNQTRNLDHATRNLPIASLAPHPDQPRRHFDEAAMDELAASIAQRGIIQPIVVRPSGHEYQIVAGERRWRAAQRARLHEVPVVVREFSDAETLEIALLENIQREDLNAIEEAEAYRRLLDEYGHTQEELAAAVNKSRSHVANLLRLLELPEAVRTRVIDGSLSMGHARALLGLSDAVTIAERVVAEGLSVRQVEQLARGSKEKKSRSQTSTGRDADITALETQLADLLGLNVKISHNSSGGTLSLGYSTLDQLDMLCQRLSGEKI